jgi:hypothetical protein
MGVKTKVMERRKVRMGRINCGGLKSVEEMEPAGDRNEFCRMEQYRLTLKYIFI